MSDAAGYTFDDEFTTGARHAFRVSVHCTKGDLEVPESVGDSQVVEALEKLAAEHHIEQTRTHRVSVKKSRIATAVEYRALMHIPEPPPPPPVPRFEANTPLWLVNYNRKDVENVRDDDDFFETYPLYYVEACLIVEIRMFGGLGGPRIAYDVRAVDGERDGDRRRPTVEESGIDADKFYYTTEAQALRIAYQEQLRVNHELATVVKDYQRAEYIATANASELSLRLAIADGRVPSEPF